MGLGHNMIYHSVCVLFSLFFFFFLFSFFFFFFSSLYVTSPSGHRMVSWYWHIVCMPTEYPARRLISYAWTWNIICLFFVVFFFCFSFILIAKEWSCFFVFCFYFNTDGKFFSKMVLVLIAQHNVHQQAIIQVLSTISVILFNSFNHKGEKYNLLMVTMQFEMSKIVLLHHKILHNLINRK